MNDLPKEGRKMRGGKKTDKKKQKLNKFKHVTSWIRFMKDSATNKQRIPESQRRVVMEGKSERDSNIWKNPVPNRGEVQISSQQPIIQGKTPILIHKTKESLMRIHKGGGKITATK